MAQIRPKTTEILFLSIAIVSASVVIAMATLIVLGMGNWFTVVGSGATMVTATIAFLSLRKARHLKDGRNKGHGRDKPAGPSTLMP